MTRRPFVALGLTLIMSVPVSATVLIFDGFNPAGSVQVPDDYGDRVTATIDANGFVYEEGFGFTPNIELEYLPDPPFVPFSVWPSGYGDLQNALGHQSYGGPGEVVLRPDPGFSVVLHSFDVGAWAGDRTGIVRVLNESDDVLFDSGSITLPGPGNGATTFLAGNPISSNSALRIQLEVYGDLGLDNVSFSQIPEPSSLLLGVFGLLLASRRLRQ